MSKTLSNFFPLIDYLYLLQTMEYDFKHFLIWFAKNPFERSLQKKHTLAWTFKAKLLFFVSIFYLIVFSYLLALVFDHLILIIPFLIIFSQVSPLFLGLAQVTIFPMEYFQKRRILTAAKRKRNTLKSLKVVAITGSFGKTSTKDILYTLLWKKYRVVKTPKSFNTPLGISQTLLEDIKDTTEVLIAEVGAYKMGEIAKISKLVCQDIAILTAVAPQHLERFGSIDNIAKAKFELVEGINEKGTAILNKQYDRIVNLAPNTKAKVLFYGTDDSPYSVSNISTDLSGTSFTLKTPESSTKIHIPLIGSHHAYNFLAASVAALEIGMTLSEIKERGKKLLSTPHRMEVTKTPSYTLIDNSFNSNLDSAKSSFALLKDLNSLQKIIITPGLIELGDQTASGNKQFISEAAKVADEIILVGELNKKYLLSGLDDFPTKHIHQVDSTNAALSLVNQISQKGAAVLIENDLPDQYF
jgi:UDP-N-acetylmuramoyl-tripeptide--D-alanyl-D-alanine ligase